LLSHFVAAQGLGLEGGNGTGDSGVFVLSEDVGREASTRAVTTVAAVAQNLELVSWTTREPVYPYLNLMAFVDGYFHGAAQAGSFDSHW
jgi:hypothetical protein